MSDDDIIITAHPTEGFVLTNTKETHPMIHIPKQLAQRLRRHALWLTDHTSTETNGIVADLTACANTFDQAQRLVVTEVRAETVVTRGGEDVPMDVVVTAEQGGTRLTYITTMHAVPTIGSVVKVLVLNEVEA